MIPDTLLDEVSPARSYGLMEDIERGRTAIDPDSGDADDVYYEDCLLCFPRLGESPASRRMDEI